ncbi:hypothetical protein G6O69_37700 [Pseudenhygromyxa sp. WMMC2535]|uniref:hypothetical protein n=1 Tax=Pseudenhygromyxa sp. WMMC2535 TaxID=2712867 RepID=UPI00155642FD|nr:hypothetical protein [Pseudenhygromyxa sp. WMMC2535]NVB37280.1 hypothetical protein [Pseudenhygromyxa sp. WMMC2535]NVB43606.1 hypothetical protein [Pseudenhygromyxa sp. WMMC2535]
MTTPGQEKGQTSPRAGFDWGDYVDRLVAERGSLAAAAAHLAQRRGFSEDLPSVERGLRRLRGRGSKDGGVWGQRALRCFGLPAAVDDRVRWMGQYHTRFSDLPTSLGQELLEPWDRPPVSESPARIWLLLGRVNLALRRRADPCGLLEQAAVLEAQAEPAARIELALVQAFVWSKPGADERLAEASAALARAGALLEERRAELDADDYACLFARWIDQGAYRLNKPRQGLPDHRGAAALY